MHPQLSLLLCEKAEVIYTMSQKLAQTKTPCASVFAVPHAASKVLHARHKPLTLASSSPLNLCCMYLFNRTTSHTCHLICLIFPHVKPNRDSIPRRCLPHQHRLRLTRPEPNLKVISDSKCKWIRWPRYWHIHLFVSYSVSWVDYNFGVCFLM